MFRTVTIVVLFCTCLRVDAQSNDSPSYAEQLAALEAELDSLSIFSLIDSLFGSEATPSSELNIRVGFTSSVTSGGRDYNIDQQGIIPGIGYYHKSGWYADLSGYWNSAAEPSYNPTVWTLGYLGTSGSRWNYSLDYEKWFFSAQDTLENPLIHSFGGSLGYDLKIATAGIDYAFLFGEETAHRFIGNLTGNINLGKWWFFKNVYFYPTASMIVGNTDITRIVITYEQLSERASNLVERILALNELTDQQQEELSDRVINAFRNGRIDLEQLTQFNFFITNYNDLSEEEIEAFRSALIQGLPSGEEPVFDNSFGLLNYSFTLPVALSTDRLSILLSYTYSIPVSLPAEDDLFEIDPVGFFGASISYRIPFK